MEQKDSPEQSDADQKEQLNSTVTSIIRSGDISHLYANGFITALGNGDVILILQRNAAPVAVINLSYTVAKTLVQKLGRVIEDFEENADHKIMTTEVVDKALAKQSGRTQ
jgi:hypothetical protein